MTSSPEISFRFASRYRAVHPDLQVATAVVDGADRDAIARRVAVAASWIKTAADAESVTVKARMSAYETFFNRFGLSSPLGRQMKAVRDKGLRDIDPIMNAMLVAELSSGVLVGAHDADTVRGEIVFDVADGGEVFDGMRSVVKCKKGEIVARDERGIIFSYLQGADSRTSITSNAKTVIYFAFGAPSLDAEALRDALRQVLQIVEPSWSPDSIVVHSPSAVDGAADAPDQPCLEPTCRQTARFRLTRTYRTGSPIVLTACRDHTDRFQELVLAVKYGDAISATVQRIIEPSDS